VRQAREAKIPITRIASEAGLSRQGVYDLLGERPLHSRVEVPFARDRVSSPISVFWVRRFDMVRV
jgi:hypothetical protein